MKLDLLQFHETTDAQLCHKTLCGKRKKEILSALIKRTDTWASVNLFIHSDRSVDISGNASPLKKDSAFFCAESELIQQKDFLSKTICTSLCLKNKGDAKTTSTTNVTFLIIHTNSWPMWLSGEASYLFSGKFGCFL